MVIWLDALAQAERVANAAIHLQNGLPPSDELKNLVDVIGDKIGGLSIIKGFLKHGLPLSQGDTMLLEGSFHTIWNLALKILTLMPPGQAEALVGCLAHLIFVGLATALENNFGPKDDE